MMIWFRTNMMSSKNFVLSSSFIFLLTTPSFSQDTNTTSPTNEQQQGTHSPQASQNDPAFLEKTEQACSFISETYRSAIAKHYSKELPLFDDKNKNTFDPRPYSELLQKFQIESPGYTQVELKEDSEKLRRPTYDNIKSKEFRISQETISKYINNFKKCLDGSLAAIKKEHFSLERFDNLDPVAKELFSTLKNEVRKSLRGNHDLISYFHEKLNFYTGICQKAHFPPHVSDMIAPLYGSLMTPPLYGSLMTLWLDDNFGAQKRESIKMKISSGKGTPSDVFHLKLSLKQVYGNNFETNLKGEPYFRISSCLSGRCKETIKQYVKHKMNEPAFQDLIKNYSADMADATDSTKPTGGRASYFAYLNKLSNNHDLKFSFDEKAQAIAADPKLYSEVLPKIIKQGTDEEKIAAKEALSMFFGEKPTQKYLSYVDPSSHSVAEDKLEAEQKFSKFREDYIKKHKTNLDALRTNKNEILALFKDEKDLQKGLNNPILLGEEESKPSLWQNSAEEIEKFLRKRLGKEKVSTEELKTSWAEAMQSIRSIDQQKTKMHEEDVNPDKIIAYQKELKDIHNKRLSGTPLTEYEKKIEPQIAKDLLALLTKAVPFLKESDSKDLDLKLKKLCFFLKDTGSLKSSFKKGYSGYCHYPTGDTQNPQEMTQRAREWPLEEWFKRSPKLKTFQDKIAKLDALKKNYEELLQLDNSLLQNHESLKSTKPLTLVLGNQAIVPDPQNAQNFRVIPAFENNPSSLEHQVKQINHELAKNLELLQINQYEYKGFRVDEKRDPSTDDLVTPLEEQVEGQRGHALKGLWIGAKDFVQRGASPETQEFLDKQNKILRDVEENLQALKNLGIPEYAQTQESLNLPYSLETLNAENILKNSRSLAIDSYNSTADNSNAFAEAIATLPAGATLFGVGHTATNLARMTRTALAAQKGSRVATFGSLYRSGELTMIAREGGQIGKITYKDALKAAYHNQKTLLGFGVASTGTSEIYRQAKLNGLDPREWNGFDLIEGMQPAILGSLELEGAQYILYPFLWAPVANMATRGAAMARLPRGASVLAKNTIEHGYWAKLGWESWSEQTHALENSKKEDDKNTRDFVQKELELMAGFVRSDKDLKYDPEAAKKEAESYFKQKSKNERDINIAEVNQWIHGFFGIGFPAWQIAKGTRIGLKTEPALDARQALKTMGYRSIPKDLSPESLGKNKEIQDFANEYYLKKTIEIENDKDLKPDQKHAALIAAGINVNLVRGTLKSQAEAPEAPPPPQQEKQEAESCGISDAIKIEAKKE
jgi:hypothetical protein